MSPNLQVKNTQELIALLKANPGKYSFGSSGSGSTVRADIPRFAKVLEAAGIQKE